MVRTTLAWALFAGGATLASPAHAYLDPGTGSIILQGLIAVIAGAAVAGKLYWSRLVAFFRGEASPDVAKDEAPGNVPPAEQDPER
ncbi:MAG: hypothetical protein ACR2RL_02935 [Gammaproteobacteria bacterium]